METFTLPREVVPPDTDKNPALKFYKTNMFLKSQPERPEIVMNKPQKIDAAIALLRDMKKDLNRLAKLSTLDYRNMSPKQCQRRDTDASWIGMENIKRKHELHALAVELGFAERRETYEPIELTDGWHRFKYQPRKPEN